MLQGDGTAAISESSRAAPSAVRWSWSVIAETMSLPVAVARREHLGEDGRDERRQRHEREERAVRDRRGELRAAEPAVAGDDLADDVRRARSGTGGA